MEGADAGRGCPNRSTPASATAMPPCVTAHESFASSNQPDAKRSAAPLVGASHEAKTVCRHVTAPVPLHVASVMQFVSLVRQVDCNATFCPTFAPPKAEQPAEAAVHCAVSCDSSPCNLDAALSKPNV